MTEYTCLVTATDLVAIDVIRKEYSDSLVGLKTVKGSDFLYDLFLFDRLGAVRVEVDPANATIKEIL